ncbi:MAG: outer membrane beta-barrel domain-containing protein [Deltaproteobacteria bacterium]|nr:outer membrane beta-barrel domain-containing protein [Deltaproteobacteria bacterium]
MGLGGLFALLCVLIPARAALAEDVIYGPDGAPTVVQHKLHPIGGKWEVGLDFGLALNTALVNHTGATLQIANHPNEWLDLGVDLAGNLTGLSGLTDQIRAKLPPRADSSTGHANTGDELAHSDALQFAGTFRAKLAPVYGKLDLASELKVHFQAYVLLGAGGGLVRHESVNLCSTAGKTPCKFTTDDSGHVTSSDFQVSSGFKPMGEVGGGFRFYLPSEWSIDLAVRAYMFPSSVIEGADLTNPASGNSSTYLGLVTMFNVGIARLF